MHRQKALPFAYSALIAGSLSASAAEPLELTGMPKLACEAVLCLTTGTPPTECDPSLNFYFNIDARRLVDTIRERKNFLQLCPSSGDENMPALINAVANGAGRCDAAYLVPRLNIYERTGCVDENGWRIRECLPAIPSYCMDYAAHPFTLIDMPIRVKQCVPAPYRYGVWSDAPPLAHGEFIEGSNICHYSWTAPPSPVAAVLP